MHLEQGRLGGGRGFLTLSWLSNHNISVSVISCGTAEDQNHKNRLLQKYAFPLEMVFRSNSGFLDGLLQKFSRTACDFTF